jgi:SAM-dependent methyltransferase
MHAPHAADIGPSSAAFTEYLEAKFALDSRSLNMDVRGACIERIASRRSHLRWLDVGTGTGAMVRRLLKNGLHAPLSVTALDADAGLLAIASSKLVTDLEDAGYRTRLHGVGIEARRADHHVAVHLPCCSLFDYQPGSPAAFDLITAHALMDILPLEAALSCFSAWLAPGGVLYVTLNYDGDTALVPVYDDEAFESALLAEYDASMERRRVRGEATGGARSGRRLLTALFRMGFDVIAYGSSDWNVTPFEGRYRDRDADVLRALLGFVRDEGERAASIDRASLTHWHAAREVAIGRGQLGMIVHQLDVLATRREGFTALT